MTTIGAKATRFSFYNYYYPIDLLYFSLVSLPTKIFQKSYGWGNRSERP